MQLTAHNALPEDVHVVVPIWTSVLVPETHHMSQLVHNYAKFVAIFPDADCLSPISTLSHKGTAPKIHKESNNANSSETPSPAYPQGLSVKMM